MLLFKQSKAMKYDEQYNLCHDTSDKVVPYEDARDELSKDHSRILGFERGLFFGASLITHYPSRSQQCNYFSCVLLLV